MPALQIKDCPQDLYNQLKICANAEDRSMSQQMVHILRCFLHLYNTLGPDIINTDQAIFRSESDLAPSSLHNDNMPGNTTTHQRKQLFQNIIDLPSVQLPEEIQDTSLLIRTDRDERFERFDFVFADSEEQR